ncbi:hypothetical protein ACWKWU_22405 [Chitinophaga lutea]
MAKQTGIFPFTGKINGVIAYKLNGQYLLRSMPERVRQTHRTRLRARQFGQASSLAAKMRRALGSFQHIPPESGTINALNTAMLDILRQDDLHRQPRFIPRHFSALKGFSFTPWCPLINVLPETPVISRNAAGDIEVYIPAIRDLGANPRSTHLCVRAIALTVHGASASAAASEPVLLESFEPCKAFTLTIPQPPDGICCVILEVQPLLDGVLLHDRRYVSAEVIGVLMPGKPDSPEVTVYFDRPGKRPRLQWRTRRDSPLRGG